MFYLHFRVNGTNVWGSNVDLKAVAIGDSDADNFAAVVCVCEIGVDLAIGDCDDNPLLFFKLFSKYNINSSICTIRR